MSVLFDMFKTTVMLKAVEQMPRLYTFLSDTFGEEGDTYADDTATYDYRKGAATGLAPIVVPGTGGIPMSREGYEMRQIKFCEMAPEREVTLEDISVRMFGEKVLGAMTPEQRAKKIMARDLTYLRTLNQNRRNWMVREVLLKGALEIRRYTREGREKEPTLFANFGFTNFYIPATKWNQAGAKIDYDMEAAFDLAYDGLCNPDVMVMGRGVFECMMDNSKFTEKLDMRNVDLGEINSKYKGQGIRFRGYNSDGVAMYSDHGKFINDDRQIENEVPDGCIILGSTKDKAVKVCHGIINKVKGQGENSEWHSYVKKEVPFRFGSEDNDVVGTRMTSRPTVVPNNVDGWVVMKVL